MKPLKCVVLLFLLALGASAAPAQTPVVFWASDLGSAE